MTKDKEDGLELFDQQLNGMKDYLYEYADGFITGLYKHGIIDTITTEKLHKLFASPDIYQKEIEDLVQYFYVSNADVHQTFEMVEILPSMNYKIEVINNNKNTNTQLAKLNKHLRKIKHKRLSRDILKQTAATGNVVGVWLGNKSAPFPYVFDDLDLAFPVGRNSYGEWVCYIDLAYLNSFSDAKLELLISTLVGLDIRSAYDKYKKSLDVKDRYYVLPQDRTFTTGTGRLKRNQVNGTSWGTTGLFDVIHKKKLKDLEQSVANKIINSVAILTIGSSDNEAKYSNERLPSAVKRKIHTGVKAALEKKQQGGVSVVTIPEYATLDFEQVNVQGLGGDKFNTVNSDIKSAYGISGAMTNGEGSNYAIAKLNLDIFYKRLGVMLEDVEDEVYGKLFNLMMPSNQADNFYLVYDKEAPLTKKERIEGLKGLTDKGWSVRHYIEELGIRFDEYLSQTLYETEDLELQKTILPYLTSYTATGADISELAGAPKVSDEDVTNENTIKTRNSDNPS